jgi:hypothetical protein
MEVIDIILPLYFAIIIIWMALIGLFYWYLFSKKTDRVIDLLKKEGYTAVAQRLEKIVGKLGKFGRRGFSYLAREHRRAWKEFSRLKIAKEKKELYKIQRSFIIFQFNVLGLIFLFLVPILIIVGFILYTIIFM